MKIRKAKRIFGMTQIQVIFLAIMGCLAFSLIAGITGLIAYNTLLGNQSFSPIPATPTTIITHPTRTHNPIVILSPTSTQVPTATTLPTQTAPPTPTLWFQANIHDFIPAEQEMPSGYKIDTGASGRLNSKPPIIDEYMVTYISNYPNDPRNRSGDPYLVGYAAIFFDTAVSAKATYDMMDESWISNNYGRRFNISSSPTQVSLNINGIEQSTAYISDYNGESVPGFFVLIKLQNHNGVFTVKTLSHAPFTDKQRSLDSAKYFASFFVNRIIR